MGSPVVEPASPPSYTEVFYANFPYYLSIGMSAEEYWNGDCELVKYYRKAQELRTHIKNQELWLQGLYVYEALCAVSPVLHAFAQKGTKPLPYPSRPYPLTEKEKEEQERLTQKEKRAKLKAAFINWSANLKLPRDERK